MPFLTQKHKGGDLCLCWPQCNHLMAVEFISTSAFRISGGSENLAFCWQKFCLRAISLRSKIYFAVFTYPALCWFLLFCMLPVTWCQTAQLFNKISNHAHKLIFFNHLYLRLLQGRNTLSCSYCRPRQRQSSSSFYSSNPTALICVFYTSLVSKALSKQEAARCALGWSCYG